MSNTLLSQMEKRVLFMDGAMGTSIHNYDLDIDRDYLGCENCTDVLVKSRPDVIQEIHESFLAVGCDAVETDTFGSNKLVLAEFGLTDQTFELNKLACEVARAACDKFSTPDRPRFVIGSIGPGTKLVTLGNTDWDTMADSYREQVRGLIAGGCDAILIETAQDILQVKCTINATIEALAEVGRKPALTPEDELAGGMPIMVQVTIEQFGTTLVGTDIAGVVAALMDFPIVSLGMNCATGPVEMAEYVRYLGQNWPRKINLLPNAGLPTLVEGRTEYPLTPQPFADKVSEFVRDYGLNFIGGCCGTTPGHLEALINTVGLNTPPTKVEKAPFKPAISSLMGAVEYRQDNSILNVGERTNASGSRLFKRLLEAENWDEIMSLARDMVKEGSHVIDVNVDYAGRDNAADMSKIVGLLVNQVNAPLMLDSTQPATIEAGLKHAGGKCIINSANLEDGEEKFGQMMALAKKYGAGIVLGTIDEDPEEAMARTADRKLAIATRMYKLATETYGLAGHDLMFDPLVLPISTGMDKDRRSALETIEGTRRIAEAFPQSQITCGLSNVSFGLAPAARQVLNSAFLHELTEAGLTSAILHVSKIVPQNRVDDAQWQAALDLIYNRWPDEANAVTLEDGSKTTDPLQIFINLFPDGTSIQSTKVDLADLPLEERMRKHIIDGEKKQLEDTLNEAMQKYRPLEIINDHLLDGMKVVGELFGSGQMQLPFVLQSAEVMKNAVAYLEPHMDKADAGGKGKMVLATVKGDVHDIGKNLVDIILSNNGYTVYNIGIKVPINEIVAAYEEHKADAIGLSGLLVKSVNVMEENLKELNDRGISVPMILGGAALSKHYCDCHLRGVYNNRVYHGTDAFEGLRLMDALMAGKSEELEAEIEERLAKRAAATEKVEALRAKEAAEAGESNDDGEGGGTAVLTRSEVATDVAIPSVPFYGSRVVEDIGLDQIFPYVNKVALFRGQWQFKKGKRSKEEYDKQIEYEVEPLFKKYQQEMKANGTLTPKVVYGYYPCQSDGDDLIIYDADDHDKPIERFSWPRQPSRKRLCVADFFRSVESGEKDVIGLTCVTMGQKVSVLAKQLFEANNYAEYLYVHGMGVECAEALAELWHKRMRMEMNIGNDDSSQIRELFTQHYRGSRYSFGYPAVPEMSDQDILFRLLEPQRIGCELTENWQIDPEQSTSAIIVHHPEAKYFNV